MTHDETRSWLRTRDQTRLAPDAEIYDIPPDGPRS